MKILVIRNAPIVGGAELYHIKLADAFKKYHLNCKLILLTNNKLYAKKARSHKIETHVVDTFGEEVGTKRGLLKLFFNLPDYLSKYLKIIEKLQYRSRADAIVFSGKTEKYVLTPLMWLFKLPVIWLEHGRVFTSTMAKEALLIYKLMSHFSSKILAEAHDTETDLLKNNIDPNKVIYLGSGIDTHYFSIKRNYHKKSFIVGFVASINREKGIRDYLEVAKKICRKNRTIQFLVVGDGPQVPFAKDFVSKNYLMRRVLLVGHQERPKKLLARMNILLSPIHHPGGISLAVEEAMSMGVVPIVTNIGGHKELISHNNSGYIISKRYTTNASRAILKLFKDRKLLKRLSVGARKHIINNFSIKLLVNMWYSILK